MRRDSRAADPRLGTGPIASQETREHDEAGSWALAARGSMKAFFFGRAECQLFGVLHSPSVPAAAGHGVVLCYPAGHEYYRAHRAFRHLAQRLARQGLHALRFDYRGSGDSAADASQAGVAAWSEDVSLAIQALRSRAGVERVSLVGRRLGASLAALCAAGRSDIASLVLWDPVVEGRVYLTELETAQHAFVTEIRGRGSSTLEGPEATLATLDGPAEYLGHTFTRSFLAELARIDLLALNPPLSSPVLVIDSTTAGMAQSSRKRMAAIGALTEIRNLADPNASKLQELLAQFVPNAILGEIIGWLAGQTR